MLHWTCMLPVIANFDSCSNGSILPNFFQVKRNRRKILIRRCSEGSRALHHPNFVCGLNTGGKRAKWRNNQVEEVPFFSERNEKNEIVQSTSTLRTVVLLLAMLVHLFFICVASLHLKKYSCSGVSMNLFPSHSQRRGKASSSWSSLRNSLRRRK